MIGSTTAFSVKYELWRSDCAEWILYSVGACHGYRQFRGEKSRVFYDEQIKDGWV